MQVVTKHRCAILQISYAYRGIRGVCCLVVINASHSYLRFQQYDSFSESMGPRMNCADLQP